jgi:hypothetical protein
MFQIHQKYDSTFTPNLAANSIVSGVKKLHSSTANSTGLKKSRNSAILLKMVSVTCEK